jgi:uracil phosphoribosyltransferase
MRELGMLMAYEVTADLPVDPKDVQTPRGKAKGVEMRGDNPVIVPILRSGIVLADGIMDVIPRVVVGHIGIHRDKRENLVTEYFVSLPRPLTRLFIVVDPVIATGATSCQAIEALKKNGVEESQIRFVSLVISLAGKNIIAQRYPGISMYCAAIDSGTDDISIMQEGLNEALQVMPGLGSVSERLFGFKTYSNKE